MDKQPSEKRFALLIDADNVSAKYIKPITDELSNYGTVTIKRIYGDWTLSLHAKWKDALLENSLTPIQQFGYTQGKNATDSAMIIDAMDILYANSVEGFCIVSSDSDFTRLASRLRESGRMVIGMGEKKTPVPFRRACDVFTTLELLLDDANGKRKGKDAPGSGPTIEEVEQAVVRIITDNQNNGKATGLGEVGSRLLKRFPDFDVRSYGTNLLSKLLGKFASVEIKKNGSDVAVELADDKESKPKAPEGAAEPEPADEAVQDAPEDEGRGDGEQPGGAQKAEDAAPSSSRRRKRRGGSRRKARAAADEEAAAPVAGGDAEAASGEGEPPSDAIAREESPEAGKEAAPAPKASKRRSRRGTRSAGAAEPAKAEAEDGAKAKPEPEAKSEVEVEPEAAAAAETGAEPDAKGAPGRGKRTDRPATVQRREADATTRQLVAEAGPDGIAVSQLASLVRSKHRGFKVRDLGYAQFKAYVADLDDIEVSRIGKEWFARMAD